MRTTISILCLAFSIAALAQRPATELAGVSAEKQRSREATPVVTEENAGYGQAMALLVAGNATGAIEELDQMLLLRPRDAQALLARAEAYSALGDMDRADADLWNVLGIQAKGVHAEKALHQLGQHAMENGDLRSAEFLFDRYVTIAPYEPLAWCHRGMVRSALHKDEAALEDLDHALELDPQMDKAHVNKAIILLRMGFRQEGCASLQMAHDLGDLSTEELLLIHCDR